MKIKKGDKVQVMRGKDKGKVAKILQVMPDKLMVVVEGANIRYRHLRQRRANESGQRVEFSAPMHVSNVMLLSPKDNKPTRVGYRVDEAGKKMRRSVKSGEDIN